MSKIELNYEKINEIRNLPIHDAELLDISCNYQDYAAQINLCLYSPGKMDVKARLNLYGIKLVNIPIEEPWGYGKYINEVTGKAKEPESGSLLFDLKLLLNSGDEILVIAKDLIYSEEE